MTSDHCPVCDRPLSDHPDGLACCPAGCDGCRCLCGDGRMLRVHCSACGWTTEYGTREEAIAWWNARAPHAETLALRATVERKNARLDLLQRMQSHMRDPERTIVCDILANGALLPDPNGTRYGIKTEPAHD